MAYLDDLLRELEERNLTGKIYNAGKSSVTQTSSTQKKKNKDYTEELLTILNEDAKKNGVKLELSDYGVISADTFKAPIEDIAPVKKKEEADDGLLDFFQAGALGDINLRKQFSDGYQFGDILKTGGHAASQVGKAILGTAGDATLGFVKGIARMGEDLGDTLSIGGSYIADALGHEAYGKQVRKTASENMVDEWTKGADEFLDKYSVLGRTADSYVQGAGQIATLIATGGLGKAAGLGKVGLTALSSGLTGLTSFGSATGEAYRGGATDEEAATYGAIAAGSDVLTELLFGGLGKAVGAVGLSTGLSSADDLLAKKVSGLFTNQIYKNFAEYGIKASAEGFEEVLAGTIQAIGKKITYMKEEELSEILKDENLLEQFVVGAALSGTVQSGYIPGTREGSLREANAQGRDFITGLNQNEQTVIDKEIEKRVAAKEADGKTLSKKERSVIEKQVLEDLDSGGIDIDTIEEVLGGETYTNYKKLVDAENTMQSEYDALGKKEKYTLADDARYKELGERLKYVREKGAKNELKTRLDEQVSSMVKDSRLSESFAERSRRGQKFEADLTQYTDEKQRAIVQKAVESGILNNTNRTREFVDMVSKIAADKDISFDFANNAKLKETGFAVEGKTVNGFLTKDGITVNIQSSKALDSVVGHEITHVLEGTELYTELQQAVFQYAETKKDLAGRRGTLTALYQNIEGADIDAELTADLVGDYLFTDSDFINNLSVNHRNVFQKIYDEVKYLLKVATAGSKEARELEKVKRAFEKAYRESAKNNTAEDGGAKYKLDADMTEEQRYEELKTRTLQVVESANQTQYQEQLDSIDALPPKAKSKAEGQIYTLAENLGILRKPMTTPEIQFEFQISKNKGLKKSLNNQLDYGGSYGDFARALVNLDQIIPNAVLIDAYTKDRYAGTARADERFEGGYVLLGAFQDSENIIPVKLTIKKEKGETGNLYVVVAMTKIKRTDVMGSEGTALDGAEQPLPVTGSNYSLQEIISKINTNDADFLKYLPDGFLSEEQKAAKQEAIAKQNAKTAKYSLNEVTEDGLTMTYVRVPNQNTPNFGSTYGQNIEPAGEYMSMDTMQGKNKIEGYEYGTIQFKKPLVLEHINTGATGWKKTVSDMYGGLTGKKLSAALIKDGYDAIVTYDEYGYNEIVNLKGKKLDNVQEGVQFSLSADSDISPVESYAEITQKQMELNRRERDLRERKQAAVNDPELLLAMDDVGSMFSEMRELLPKKRQGTATQAELDRIEELKALREEKIARVAEIQESVGLNAISKEESEIRQAKEELRVAADAAWKREGAERENAAIAKAGVSAQEYFRKKALKAFKTTSNFNEAGYLLPDGKLLNFSGGERNHRYRDHREIGEIYEATNGVDALNRFLNDGNIRIMAESPGIDLAAGVEPTTEQYAAIRRFVKSHGTQEGQFYVDFSGEDGRKAGNYSYEGRVNAERVINDIKYYYANGEIRQQSEIGQFLSLSPEGAKQRTFGNYNVYGRDIALETAEDIAPVAAPVADIAPVRSEAAVYEEPEQEESVYAELDRLTEQAEELERQMYEAMDAGDNEKAMAINADLVDAAVRITELEQQLDADTQERLASFEDADAPIAGEAPYSESTDTMTLPKKMVQDIARDVRKVLGFSAKQVPEMRTLVEKFSQGEIDSEQLHDEIAQRFGTIIEKNRQEDIAEVRNWLRTTRLNVSDEIKSDFPEYGKNVVQANRGRILFAKDGAGVDSYYEELADKFPGFFSVDIINPANRLQRIIEVANMDINTESGHEIDDETLDKVTDSVVRSVNEYKREQRLKMSEQNAFESFNGLMRDADRYAPVTEDDIAPVRADVAQTAPTEPVQESAPAADQPIKTVKERLTAKLHNLQTELQRNQQLREESNAEYERQIAELQTDYYERRNKNTKAANDILRRMERLRRIQGNVDADYAKRINDLSEQVAKVSEEARTGESAEAQGAMRRELHARIVENIRAKFAERGYDLETVLKNAKDLSTFATVDNTPQRVMEKALGYKEGQILSDLTVNQVAANETKGISWLNGYTDRKTGLLAQISKQYNIKPGSNESAAAQMYAEGFYVNGNDEIVEYGDRELALDFPDAKVQENIKGLAGDPRIRQIYDATLAMINESRARNAYPEIQKLDNYFLHFRAMDDTFSRLGIPFNPNDIKAKDLPTDLNGVTADLKPGQPYFASAMHRKGKKTSFDLLGGLERYLTSAKGQIYHIDDIQTLRALRNHIADTYGQAHGLEGLDALTEEEVQDRIEDVYGAHLSTFAKFLNEEANVIAGKTALIDRGLEGIIGRRGMTFFDTLNRQVGANMVGFNVSSSLTNLIAPVQAFAKTNKAAFVKGFAQTVANRVGSIAGKTDGFMESNPTMIRRQGADRFNRTPWQKASDLGYALMGAVDSISTEIVVRGKYNELVSKGMSAEQAVIEADKWASRLMGDRSLGQQPQIFNSKMLGIVTKFQLEVRNQLDSQFYDTIQEAKVSAEDIQNKQARNAKTAAQVASTFVQLAVVQHLFGKAFEAVAGYNPAFDIIEAIIKAFGWDDEEESEDTVLDNLGQGFMNLLEDMPYSSVATGGRIPISSALPVAQFIKGEDQYGNEKSRWETVAETAPYWLLPGGYGQIKKTTQGLGMFDDDLPIAGSYTDSGNLRYPVEDTLASRVQAAVFGQYASSNARDYFDNERQALKKNQIQELVDVDIPIKDYWAYREGLNEQETLAEKFDYIAGLDLPIDKKNILINNVVDRKEAVDLTGYDQYADYEEFDFAVKNPEKYDFLQSVGVSVAEYNNFDDDTKDAYNWAYQNPEKYTLSRAVTDDVAVYRQYTKALNDISADKTADGKSISGSRKTKVINYLNDLDADYYTKIILFKMEYNADDTYNREIIEYLNGRNDISFEEEVTILRELGFTVTADGTVRW